MEVDLKLGEDFELRLDHRGNLTSLEITDAGMAKLGVFGDQNIPVVLTVKDETTITVKPQNRGPVIRRVTEG